MPDSTGSTATESVTVPSGGAGVGIFYVVTTAAVVTNPTATPPTNSGTPAAATPPATTPPATSPPALVPATPLAFTGAFLTWEWLIGLVTILFGAGLVVIGRRRRGLAAKGVSP
jgi:hypothetical protein